ncbi:MAG: ATP-binding protein [Chlamydiota bacterium]|nr:ATP-binding protein [Chlamydiota bacterium]
MKKILLVDDSELIHAIYGTDLKEAGFNVLHAYDGLSAINMALEECPELIFLDINMPKINGYQVCRLLKDHQATKHIPIIIGTTAQSAAIVSDPREWSFQTGADGYVDKEKTSTIVDIVREFVDKTKDIQVEHIKSKSMSEMEIMLAISQLLDKQLYRDVTRLRELNERKNAFVSNVSHELLSPLTVIKSIFQNVACHVYGSASNEMKDAMNMGDRTVDRLSRLINDLLDVAKIEAGALTLNYEIIDIDVVINEILDSYKIVTDDRKIIVKKENRSIDSSIECDKERLMQVIINLFSNCIKYSPENGVITFRLFNEGKCLRFEIEDQGPGVSKENLDNIFNKFVRIKAEKREGTGLGLPIARDIVVLHHGSIWAESQEGFWTKFIVVLPMSRK